MKSPNPRKTNLSETDPAELLSGKLDNQNAKQPFDRKMSRLLTTNPLQLPSANSLHELLFACSVWVLNVITRHTVLRQ